MRTQQYIQLSTEAKEIQQVNPSGPDNRQFFYKYKTTDYRRLWDKTQSNYKGHNLKEELWNSIRKSVELPVWGPFQNIHIFSKISSSNQFIWERSAETKKCKSVSFSVFASILVKIWRGPKPCTIQLVINSNAADYG